MANKKKQKKAVPVVKNQLEDIKSDFITVASHQLRTPISAVRWSLDTLLSGRAGNLTDRQKEVTNEAYQNNKFMIKVVNDLLRVSRIEEKGIILQPKDTDILPIIKDLVDQYKPLAAAFNCSIEVKTDLKKANAFVDSLQIKPVLEALIDNSVRYTQVKGKILISLNKTKDYLVFKVRDNGIGIPDNEQKEVFSKFYRGSNAMKSQTEGLGLNLYLAKKVIDASGGKISFASKKGKGTLFILYLPLNKKEVKDVTINKKEEQQEQVAEETLKKEREFVSITVHELKAPLGIAKWSLEMLKSQRQGKLNADQVELIDQVYRGNERLLTLVRDLLNLSKLQEGRFEVELKPITLETIISDTVKGFKVQATEKKIELVWQKSKNKLPKVLADNSRVAQVLTNLVSNAIKYTPDNGKVFIKTEVKTAGQLKVLNKKSKTINIENTENKKGYLVVSVKDTGIGISEEDKQKLFTRFFRSKKHLKSQTEGTGLGLYITKSIVNLHKGDIWFESKLGAGSIFYFSLPIV